jgi:hypothetical protein
MVECTLCKRKALVGFNTQPKRKKVTKEKCMNLILIGLLWDYETVLN